MSPDESRQAAGPGTLAGVGAPPSEPSSPESPGAWWPGFVWLVGAAAMASRRGLGCLLILLLHRRRELRVERQVHDSVQRLARGLGIRSAVAVKVAPGLSSPIALGFLRPTIALPAGFTREYIPAHQEVILAHELAHLAGRDPLWLLLADLVTACLWWHPLAWWARERLLKACEIVADEASALLEDGPLTLATCLVALGNKKLEWARVATGIRGGGFRSSLGRRVERLISLGRRSWRPPGGFRSWMARVLGLSLVVSLMAFPLAWARPQASEWPEEGGQEMEAMTRSFKHSLAGMVLFAVLGTGSDRTFSQEDPFGKPAVPPQDVPEKAAPAKGAPPRDYELLGEDSDKPRPRSGSWPKKGNVTIEAQILEQLQALSKRLDAIEDELAQKEGFDRASKDFSKAYKGWLKADNKPQKNSLNELLEQGAAEGPETKQADDKQDFFRFHNTTAGLGADAAKWEYKVVSLSDLSKGPTRILKGESDDTAAFREHAAGLERALNELGEQGWELSTVTEIHYVFKRRPAAPGTSFGSPRRQ